MKKSMIVGLVCSILSVMTAHAVLTTPWYDSFGTDPALNTNYIISVDGTATWLYDSTNGTVTADGGTNAGNWSLVADFSDLGGTATNDFKINVILDDSNWYNQMNLVALSTVAGGSGYDAYYRGKTRDFAIKREGTSVITAQVAEFKADGLFDLTLSGHYNAGGQLELTFTAIDENGLTNVLEYTDSSPLDGQRFGISGRSVAGQLVTVDSMAVGLFPPRTTPWIEPFDADPDVDANYTLFTSDTAWWSHDTNGTFTAFGGTGAGNYAVYTELSDMGGSATEDFTMTANVYSDAGYNQINLAAFGSVDWKDGYLAYVRPIDDSITLRRGAYSSSADVLSVTGAVVDVGNYILTLSGHYNGEGGLDLTFSIIDGSANTLTLNWTDTAPLIGKNFGVGGRAVQVDKQVSLDFVSVEKSSAVYESEIISIEPAGANSLKLVISASSGLENYRPVKSTNLTSGVWSYVAHSDTAGSGFVMSNLSYSATEGSNAVVYVQPTNFVGFYGISQ